MKAENYCELLLQYGYIQKADEQYASTISRHLPEPFQEEARLHYVAELEILATKVKEVLNNEDIEE